MLTPRENLLRIFRHETPEWIPICGHCDPYNQPSRDGMDPELAAQLGTVTWGDESTVRFSQYLGIDIMDWAGPQLRSSRHGCEAETRQEGNDTITVWHTPQGELNEVRRHSPDVGTSYTVEHLVKGPDDLPALAAIFEDHTFELNPDRVTELRKRRELIGDGGIIALPLPGTPLGMMIRVHAGVAATTYLCTDGPHAIRDLFAVMEQNHARQYRLAAQLDGEAIVAVDDTSTTTLSPAMFENSCLGYTDRMAQIAHDAGKLYFHHSCGHIRDILGLYSQTNMDAVHAFTEPPVGNVTIDEGRKLLGEKITIIAGVKQLAGPMDDREAVRASIRDMFARAAPGDHMVFNLAAYPDKTMAQTRFVVDECKRYQTI